MAFALEIAEVDDHYNYNMETSSDSSSPSSKSPLRAPKSVFNLLPQTSPSQPISTSSCIPQTSVSRYTPLHRSSISSYPFKDSALHGRAQAPHDNSHTVIRSVYLSPPSTGSQLNRSQPLPTFNDNGRSSFFASEEKFEAGGILDSPLVMRREELSSLEKPLSPPLTLPLSTLTLPETESEFSSADHDGYAGSVPSQEETTLGSRKDTLSEDNEETFSDLLQSEGMDLFQLSSLSPAWMSGLESVPENSTLLGSSPMATRGNRRSLSVDLAQSHNCGGIGSYKAHGFNSSPPWSPQSTDVALPLDIDINPAPRACSNSLFSINDFESYQPTRFLTRPPDQRNGISTYEQSCPFGSDSLPTPVSPQKANLSPEGSCPSGFWTPDSSASSPRPSHAYNRPFLQPLDIPESPYHTLGSPNICIPSLFDDDYSMDVDENPAPLPMLSPYEVDHTFYLPTPSPSYAEPLPPPNSPSIPGLSLPDLIGDESPPSSPSRRSLTSLPDLEIDDPPDTDFPVASPAPSLLSLPGADTDEDLLPPPPANFSTPSPPPPHSSPSLLFIDDPRDVPLPRSPSPEDFDLNIVLDDDSDTELMKLYSLHKKSLAAERAARYSEAQLIDAGSIVLRAEATRDKKRYKQRSKELGALLRIKLGDKVASSSSEDQCSRGMIGSISKLVARMMFRRRETSRPLAQRSLASMENGYVRSSLSRSIVADI